LLSSLGRPLNSAIFAIHKLIAVGAIILLGLSLRNMLKAADVQVLSLIFLVIAGLLFLALVISGALMSFERPFPQIFLNIHKVVPLLALVAAMMSIYSMAGSKS
jgi:hypothetical protein